MPSLLSCQEDSTSKIPKDKLRVPREKHGAMEVGNMSGKVQEVLNDLIRCFESGNIPEAIAYSFFPAPDLPSAKWSLLNRMLVLLSGTPDARGYRQWLAVKRHVRKGAKAIYILVPRFVKAENEEGETEKILAGFLARPVFRVEDTEGYPLSYQQEIEVSKLPLIEKAQDWGISVKAVPGNYHYYGYFSKGRMEIGLATRDEVVFFHELAHAAHSKIKGNRKTPEWQDEVVAELAAAALYSMTGRTSRFLGNNYRYISHYASQANLSPIRACLQVIGDVEKVLGLILCDQKEAIAPADNIGAVVAHTQAPTTVLRSQPLPDTRHPESRLTIPQPPLISGERGLWPLQEEAKMPDGKLATPRQLAYIERLAGETGMKVAKPLEELTVREASEVIDELTDKANNGNSATGKRNNNWSKGARIGLAFKVCYHRWISSGNNIFINREEFIKNVLDTYDLLNEIADKAEAA
jgi:hypothetical protein